MFSIRMALEFNGQVFNLNLNRLESGVLYFHLEDLGVQIQPDIQRSELVGVEDGQPTETQTLSPGAEEGTEAIPPQAPRARVPMEGPGGPEGEGVEPPPPAGMTGAGRGSRSRRGRGSP